IAPERAIPRERDERLAQIAERELPELIHQSSGAAATIGHGDDGGNPTLIALEAGEDREWACSATDRDHLLVKQEGAHVGLALRLLFILIVFHPASPLENLMHCIHEERRGLMRSL